MDDFQPAAHSISVTGFDADMSHPLTQRASGMATSLIILDLSDVLLECPNCGWPHLNTDTGVEYLMNEEDAAYWRGCNLPVIVVLVKLERGWAYWKSVDTGTGPTGRRLRIDKNRGVLHASSRGAIAEHSLAKAGMSIRDVHLHTIQPFNAEPLLNYVGSVWHGVVTMEDHIHEGAMGSLVVESMADAGGGKRLVRRGLNGTCGHCGLRPSLMRYYGLDAIALVRCIEELMDQDLGITEFDLAAARVEDVQSLTREKAL